MTESKREKRQWEREVAAARQELNGLRDRLDAAYGIFDRTTAPEDLEACVYEINALRARYNAAFRHYKERFFQ